MRGASPTPRSAPKSWPRPDGCEEPVPRPASGAAYRGSVGSWRLSATSMSAAVRSIPRACAPCSNGSDAGDGTHPGLPGFRDPSESGALPRGTWLGRSAICGLGQQWALRAPQAVRTSRWIHRGQSDHTGDLVGNLIARGRSWLRLGCRGPRRPSQDAMGPK